MYYPDWRFNPVTRPKKIQGAEVQWDTPVYHVKTGGLAEWKFGLSEVYSSIDWAKAYKDFLEDVASLMRSYSRFAYKLTLKGGTSKGVQATKTKLNSTYGTEGVMGETNPSPVVGSTFIGNDNYDLQPMNLRGASISPDDGRRLLLMVASSAGLPETFFGDIKGGTLATGKTLDRPTELMMRNRQMFWSDVLKNIFQFVITQAVKATSGPLKKLGKIVTSEFNGLKDEELMWNSNIKARLEIAFPPVLERDIQTSVQAIVAAATLNGQDFKLFDEETIARLLLTALAQENADEIMSDIYPNETPAVGQTNAGNTAPEDQKPSTEHLRKAARELLESLNLPAGKSELDTQDKIHRIVKQHVHEEMGNLAEAEKLEEANLRAAQEAAAEPTQPPTQNITINVTNQLPDQPAPEVTVNNEVNVPDQPAPEVTVNNEVYVPEQAAPNVTVENVVNNEVNVPEQPAPTVNINNEVKLPEAPARKITIKKDGNTWKGETK